MHYRNSPIDRPSNDDQPETLNAQNIDLQLPILSTSANTATTPTSSASPNTETSPRPAKRLACVVCRRRKLKCDGKRPSCGTCARLGHDCAYDEVRRKSGPKRGYVKALEERLRSVETMLMNPSVRNTNRLGIDDIAIRTSPSSMEIDQEGANEGLIWHQSQGYLGQNDAVSPDSNVSSPGFADKGKKPQGEQLTVLGLEEALPDAEVAAELFDIYFSTIHITIPILHRSRFLASMNLPAKQQPPVALRYAIWALACVVSDKHDAFKEEYYQRSRKYLERDYMNNYGESALRLAHAQTHVLCTTYEYRMMYFPRAWMSSGATIRASLMMGLHRLDQPNLEVKQCLPKPRDWTEAEERRRTFWIAYIQDRCGSIGTGWPMSLNDEDIATYLPSSEEAFQSSTPEPGIRFEEILAPRGASKLTPFGGMILMSNILGRNLYHLHRSKPEDHDDDLHGAFWERHRDLDNYLFEVSLSLPQNLRLPLGNQDPNVIFTNMGLHASTICLHQAALYKGEINNIGHEIMAESKVRCIASAREIASIMRLISHTDLSVLSPFITFCLYVAARVFIQYMRSQLDDMQLMDSLRFLLTALNVFKKRAPLAESFIVQLEVELEALEKSFPSHSHIIRSIYTGDFLPSQVQKRGSVDGMSSNDRDGPSSVDHLEKEPSSRVPSSVNQFDAYTHGPSSVTPDSISMQASATSSSLPTSAAAPPPPPLSSAGLFDMSLPMDGISWATSPSTATLAHDPYVLGNLNASMLNHPTMPNMGDFGAQSASAQATTSGPTPTAGLFTDFNSFPMDANVLGNHATTSSGMMDGLPPSHSPNHNQMPFSFSPQYAFPPSDGNAPMQNRFGGEQHMDGHMYPQGFPPTPPMGNASGGAESASGAREQPPSTEPNPSSDPHSHPFQGAPSAVTDEIIRSLVEMSPLEAMDVARWS